MFAQIYTGCKCKGGETWRVGIHTEFDISNDEECQIRYCTVCYGDNLTEKKMPDGTPCYHALAPEDIQEEIDLGKMEEDDWESNV